jgi:excisionase family DNA binding protein
LQGFSSRALLTAGREVPDGYVLAAPDGVAGRGPTSAVAALHLFEEQYADRKSRGPDRAFVPLRVGHVHPGEAPYLKPSEAAEITGLSTRAIYRAIERGELRAARLCSRMRIPRAAFDEWVEWCVVRAPERRPRRTRVYLRRSPGASGRFSPVERGERTIEPPLTTRDERAEPRWLPGGGWTVHGLRDFRHRPVRPDAVIELDRGEEVPHTLLIEFDRTRRVDKNFEKFRRYDTFLVWWWNLMEEALHASEPYVIFVCQDEDQLDQFLHAADYELTGHHDCLDYNRDRFVAATASSSPSSRTCTPAAWTPSTARRARSPRAR